MSYQTWLYAVCSNTPPDLTPVFTTIPTDGCIDTTTDECFTCENGTISGYRYRVNGGPWVDVADVDCPLLQVTVVADTTFGTQAGDVVTYTTTVSNLGAVAATNVTVSSSVPLMPFAPPSFTTIPAGGQASTTSTYVITAVDVTAGSVDLSVTATADVCPDNSATVTATGTSTIPTTAGAQPQVVEINYAEVDLASFPEQDRYCLEAAVALVNQIVVAPLSPAAIVGNPAYTGIQIRLRVDPALPAVGAVATGGALTLRDAGTKSLTGQMNWNPEWLSNGVHAMTCESFMDVAVHELMHALGLTGYLPAILGFATPGTCGVDGDPDTADDVYGEYTGPLALAEYQAAVDPGATFIPLQCGGGHWLEGIPTNLVAGLDTEIMTPYLNTPEPLSRITIAALDDIGYPVSYTAAEPYP